MMLPQSLAKVTNDVQLYLLNAFHATLNWVSDRSEYLISSNWAHSCILVRPIPILHSMAKDNFNKSKETMPTTSAAL